MADTFALVAAIDRYWDREYQNIQARGRFIIEHEFERDYSNVNPVEVSEAETIRLTSIRESFDSFVYDGVCMICMENAKVLKSGYYHKNFNDECEVNLACLSCLKQYFVGRITDGFNGVCPKMNCPFCEQIVNEMIWGALVEKENHLLFRNRASLLLSFQCLECDRRSSLFDSVSYDRKSKEFKAAMINEMLPDALEDYEAGNMSANCFLELVGYSIGVDLNKRCSPLSSAYLSADIKYIIDLIKEVLKCVNDWERRAVLHCRFLYLYPYIESKCCSTLHCYCCRTLDVHPGISCNDFQRCQPFENVVSCPECRLQIVKGDGCDLISCLCGAHFSFNSRLQEMKEDS